jgi:hypothetical protein
MILRAKQESLAPAAADASAHNAARRAERALRESSYPDLRGVACGVDEGVLVLRGRVASFYLKQIAQTIVNQLGFREGLLNLLVVDDRARAVARPGGPALQNTSPVAAR